MNTKTKIELEKIESRLDGRKVSIPTNLSVEELIEWNDAKVKKLKKNMNSGYTTIPDGMSNEELRQWFLKSGNKEIGSEKIHFDLDKLKKSVECEFIKQPKNLNKKELGEWLMGQSEKLVDVDIEIIEKSLNSGIFEIPEELTVKEEMDYIKRTK